MWKACRAIHAHQSVRRNQQPKAANPCLRQSHSMVGAWIRIIMMAARAGERRRYAWMCSEVRNMPDRVDSSRNNLMMAPFRFAGREISEMGMR